MCYKNCKYENSWGECKLGGDITIPSDAKCHPDYSTSVGMNKYHSFHDHEEINQYSECSETSSPVQKGAKDANYRTQYKNHTTNKHISNNEKP